MEPIWQPCTSGGWRRLPVKRTFKVTLGKMLQNTPAYASDEQITYLKAQNVQWDNVVLEDLPAMWASEVEIEALQVKRGDLLVCEGGEVGRAAIIDSCPKERTIIQNALHLVRGKFGADTRFLKYLLRHAYNQGWFDILCNKSTIAHFTVEKFENLWIWLPTDSEQKAIADYLDRETAYIDELIAAKERLLDLLAEKRQSFITRAVTRGLDQNVAMRDTGIPWLGKIPAHWKLKRLRYLGEPIIGLTFSPTDTVNNDKGVLVLRASNVQDQRIVLHDNIYVSMEIPHQLITQVGDILICSRSGSRELIGKNAQIDEASAGLTFGTFMTLFRSLYNDYLFYVFNSPIFEHQAGAYATSTINQLTIDTLKNLKVPVPPDDEQQEIVDFMRSYAVKFNQLIQSTNKTITLLKERRSSLIAAAVTGQFDVGIAA